MAPLTLARLLPAATAVLAAGCGRAERPAVQELSAAGPSARTDAAPAGLRVSNVMIGRRIGSGNRIIEPTFEFAPTDTVYVSVATAGTGGGILTGAWRSQGGEILEQSSVPVQPGQNTALQLSRPKGFRPGTDKVVLFLGEDSVDAKVFVVRK